MPLEEDYGLCTALFLLTGERDRGRAGVGEGEGEYMHTDLLGTLIFLIL